MRFKFSLKDAEYSARKPIIPSVTEESFDPESGLFFARQGLQDKLLRRLRQGKIRIECQLDLHGMKWSEAAEALEEFLNGCQSRGYRCVLMIPGKGQVLKARLSELLRFRKEVLAFSTAQPRHGGAGALYVLLKSKKD